MMKWLNEVPVARARAMVQRMMSHVDRPREVFVRGRYSASGDRVVPYATILVREDDTSVCDIGFRAGDAWAEAEITADFPDEDPQDGPRRPGRKRPQGPQSDLPGPETLLGARGSDGGD